MPAPAGIESLLRARRFAAQHKHQPVNVVNVCSSSPAAELADAVSALLAAARKLESKSTDPNGAYCHVQ